MAEQPRSDETHSPTRPGSAWTSDSLFADSAISLRTATPKPSDEDDMIPSEIFEPQSRLADRLRGLVSEVWATEQDGTLHVNKRRKIEAALNNIEAALVEDDSGLLDDKDSEVSPLHTLSITTQTPLLETELDSVRESLASTIDAMRMRQQEQRHLHQLTMEKLEAVAERCLQQEEQMQHFRDEVVALKDRNRRLNRRNEALHSQLDRSRAESRKQDDAVHAMSSAVAGLEGWINGTPSPDRGSRKVVVRGRGRFRGRYYADEPEPEPSNRAADAASDAKTIHEGVNAWLRGFNDIEQELRSTSALRQLAGKDSAYHPSGTEDDEWDYNPTDGF